MGPCLGVYRNMLISIVWLVSGCEVNAAETMAAAPVGVQCFRNLTELARQVQTSESVRCISVGQTLIWLARLKQSTRYIRNWTSSAFT